MKKTLVSALTTALVVGAASTTFAAANPFQDVPADHWAYDAVAQLANDGVIDGYDDGTFRGQQSITRYEMAQMVAKAMAKNDVSAANKAMIDKLAAEFSDELNNLGVRVSNLEKNADKVKWNGKIQYVYEKSTTEVDGEKDNDHNYYKLRFEPTAEINDNWTAKARIDYVSDADEGNNGDTTVSRIYAQGDYKNFSVMLGKFPDFSLSDNGMIFDDDMSGAEVTFGKELQATLYAGRYNKDHSTVGAGATKVGDHAKDADSLSGKTFNMMGIDLNYTKGKFGVGAGYRHLKLSENYADWGNNEDKNGIWDLGVNYKFDKNWAAYAAYAKSSADKADQDKAYSIEVDWKGADAAVKGSYGVFAAYRYLGSNAAIYPTYDAMGSGNKGWEFGASYVPFTNVMGTLKYYTGKTVDSNDKTTTLWGTVELFF